MKFPPYLRQEYCIFKNKGHPIESNFLKESLRLRLPEHRLSRWEKYEIGIFIQRVRLVKNDERQHGLDI